MLQILCKSLLPQLWGWPDLFPSDWFGPAVLLSSHSLALASLAWDSLRRRRHASPPLFLYWLAVALCSAPTFKVQVEELQSSSSWQSSLLASSSFPVSLLLFLANCFPDLKVLDLPPKGSPERRRVAPEYTASVLSTMIFSWLDQLVYQG